MLSRENIYQELTQALVELFEVDAKKITPKAHLYLDLDLDSIDAVDLVIRLQELTGKKIKPEEFKLVRTISDVTDAIEKLINE